MLIVRYRNGTSKNKISETGLGKLPTQIEWKPFQETGVPVHEDPEYRKKISKGNKGQKRSEETRRKMSEAKRKRYGTDPNTPAGRESACVILKKHAETLKEDPEHLSTKFIQKLIGIDRAGL